MSDDFLYDVVIVGAGPVGAATARHAAESGARVLVIGPEEPATPEEHQGTWAGYYDQGRMCHVLEVPLVASLLTMRSRRRFDALIERTGINFLTPTHSVMVLPAEGVDERAATWFDKDVLAQNAQDLGVFVEDLDEVQLAANYPRLRFEPGHVALREPDAYVLNPRALVSAELAAATAAGAEVRRDEVVALARDAEGVLVKTAEGSMVRASRVVVATGAATNATGLLDRPLVTPTFGATVVLAEVKDSSSVAMPSMMMIKARDGERLFGGVVIAPIQYPDGRWYIKVAGSRMLANPMDTREEIAAWVRTGGDSIDVEDARAVLSDLLPDVEVIEFRTRPCLVCATATERPYIDWVDDRTVVAIEGQRGAMAADEIGRLAAGLATTGVWTDSIPQELFAAVWADSGWTTAAMLAAAGR